jgi:hypothetical protein
LLLWIIIKTYLQEQNKKQAKFKKKLETK